MAQGPYSGLGLLVIEVSRSHIINLLTPNDDNSGRTAPLTSKRCILYIYSTNTGTEYFKHGIYAPFFPLQNAVCAKIKKKFRRQRVKTHTPARTYPAEWSTVPYTAIYTTHNKHETNFHALGGIRTRNLSNRAATDLCLSIHGHRDRVFIV